jgi:tetratricopeptide (TPR) repeat protein
MPEKSLTEIPRTLREQFDRGMAAYHKNNLDYAITLFTDVLQKEPALHECREALRAAQHRRGGSGGGMARFKKFLGQASPALAKGQMALRSNPAEAMHCAEQALNEDPRNPAAHELLARGALALGLPRTAVLSLEIVFKNDPGNREAALRLAEALIAAGQTTRADRIYADLLAANPADLAVARAYKDLGAKRTLAEKGYSAMAAGTGTYRDGLKDQAEAVSLEQEARSAKGGESGDRQLAEYTARFEREPDNLKLLRSIADLHVQRREFDRALATYERLVAAEGTGDPSLQKAIADTRIRQFDVRLEQLDASAPDYPEAKAALEKERDEFRLAECRARVEKYPTDLAIRFELGELWFRAGRITEAIQELQKAQAHPNRRLPAMALLAKCFSRRGMNDLAARTLQNALREKPVFDDEKKDLVYELGAVLEKMGRADEAVEQFKLIYEMDIGYRDVAARVDAYYAAKGG